MRNRFYIILVLLLSCANNNSNDTQLSFEELYNRLPLVELPISCQTSSDRTFTRDFEDITDSTLLKRFGSKDGFIRPIGRLNQNLNLRVVLSFMPDDVGTPIITTYDKAGNKLDSLYLFDDRPAATVGLRSKEFVTITKECKIQFVDSSKYLDTLDNVTNTEVIKKNYSIDNKGKIKKEK
jgi:hypothetical protein